MKPVRIALLSILLGVMPAISQAQDSQARDAANTRQKAVLVTGASSGIGRNITERLAANGYFVYAGARKQADIDALNAIRNVQAVRLDVTSQDEIDAAVETVSKGGRGLYGVVNNAGIAVLGPLTIMSSKEFDLVMAVNTRGPFLVTRAFAPLVIAAKGRVVNIGSISGILNEPDAGAYQMSKHAIETYTATLAKELAPAGVRVSVVEPGSYKSDIFQNMVERSGLGEGAAAEWATLTEPDDVSAATERALFEPTPKLRYMVVPNAQQAEITVKAQIEQLVQLNEDQPYTYDRQALIDMLDAALKTTRPRTQE